MHTFSSYKGPSGASGKRQIARHLSVKLFRQIASILAVPPSEPAETDNTEIHYLDTISLRQIVSLMANGLIVDVIDNGAPFEQPGRVKSIVVVAADVYSASMSANQAAQVLGRGSNTRMTGAASSGVQSLVNSINAIIMDQPISGNIPPAYAHIKTSGPTRSEFVIPFIPRDTEGLQMLVKGAIPMVDGKILVVEHTHHQDFLERNSQHTSGLILSASAACNWMIGGNICVRVSVCVYVCVCVVWECVS